jgi:hypothetical protein
MGVCYKIANHTKRQFIDPERIGGGESKLHAIAYWDPGRVMAFAMTDEWMGDHVSVESDNEPDRIASYEDVTPRMVRRYNMAAPTCHVSQIVFHDASDVLTYTDVSGRN